MSKQLKDPILEQAKKTQKAKLDAIKATENAIAEKAAFKQRERDARHKAFRDLVEGAKSLNGYRLKMTKVSTSDTSNNGFRVWPQSFEINVFEGATYSRYGGGPYDPHIRLFGEYCDRFTVTQSGTNGEFTVEIKGIGARENYLQYEGLDHNQYWKGTPPTCGDKRTFKTVEDTLEFLKATVIHNLDVNKPRVDVTTPATGTTPVKVPAVPDVEIKVNNPGVVVEFKRSKSNNGVKE
jgi:hypothetical protein